MTPLKGCAMNGEEISTSRTGPGQSRADPTKRAYQKKPGLTSITRPVRVFTSSTSLP